MERIGTRFVGRSSVVHDWLSTSKQSSGLVGLTIGTEAELVRVVLAHVGPVSLPSRGVHVLQLRLDKP
jgi:hypothetical protein